MPSLSAPANQVGTAFMLPAFLRAFLLDYEAFYSAVIFDNAVIDQSNLA